MHDPQEEIKSGKEDLKREEGLERVAKDPWADVAKVSCSHEHKLSQPCRFLQIFVLSHCVACCEPYVVFLFAALSENASFHILFLLMYW